MFPTVAELTSPYLNVYTRVPRYSEADICQICHVPRDPLHPQCWSCSKTAGGVSRPVTLVVPVSLYQSYSQLGRWLRRYKDPDATVTSQLQRRYATLVAATFGRFFAKHKVCIEEAAGKPWDVITVVPSTTRPQPHPFEKCLSLLPDIESLVRPLLRRGDATIARNSPSDDGYQTIEDVEGSSVLLVDDTWTTGAHLQSAASVLQLAGADVVAAVVVGRVVRTDWRYTDESWWSEMRQTPFSFDTCCLE